MVTPELETVIAQSHEALRKILNGDPSSYAALFADREDVHWAIRSTRSAPVVWMVTALWVLGGKEIKIGN